MLISIYGRDLGPRQGCEGQADTRRKETPNPRRPQQSFAETLIYPQELCGVRVLVGDKPAGLLYVQEKQINFKVPQDIPLEGTAQLKVTYQGRSNSPARVSLGLEIATLSVEGIARVDGPVWIRIDLPYGWGFVQYPVGIHPADFGCHEFEVRRNGTLLPRIALRATGGVRGGGSCGNIGIPGHPMQHPGRLPLHLQYRLEKPGIYEVRYTRKRAEFGPASAEVLLRSAWTRIEVLTGEPVRRRALPQYPAEVLSHFLPGLLGFPDSTSLSIVLEYLYHPNDTPYANMQPWGSCTGPRRRSIAVS